MTTWSNASVADESIRATEGGIISPLYIDRGRTRRLNIWKVWYHRSFGKRSQKSITVGDTCGSRFCQLSSALPSSSVLRAKNQTGQAMKMSAKYRFGMRESRRTRPDYLQQRQGLL